MELSAIPETSLIFLSSTFRKYFPKFKPATKRFPNKHFQNAIHSNSFTIIPLEFLKQTQLNPIRE